MLASCNRTRRVRSGDFCIFLDFMLVFRDHSYRQNKKPLVVTTFVLEMTIHFMTTPYDNIPCWVFQSFCTWLRRVFFVSLCNGAPRGFSYGFLTSTSMTEHLLFFS